MFAHSSGAVVTPEGEIKEVVAKARTVEAADAASREELAREWLRDAGTPLQSTMGELASPLSETRPPLTPPRGALRGPD